MCCVVCLVLAPALCMEQMEGKAFLTQRQISMFIWIKNLWWILGGKTKMGDNDVLSIIKYGKVWETWESIASEVMEKDFSRSLERPEKSLLQSSKSLKVLGLISPGGKTNPIKVLKSFVFVLSSLLTFKSYTQIKFSLWLFWVPSHFWFS